MGKRNRIILDLLILAVVVGGIYLLVSKKSFISGFPAEEEIPEWLPSPPVPHPRLPISLYTFFDEESRSRQIYLFPGSLQNFDPAESTRLTSSEGDKSDPIWGPDLENTDGCTGPSFFYGADDLTQNEPTPMPQKACIDGNSLESTPSLVFEGPQIFDEIREEPLVIEGLELGPKKSVPNLENLAVFMAKGREGLFLAVLQCEQALLLPLPQELVSQEAVYWGGAADSGKYLEAIFEVKDEGHRNLVYYKKSVTDCRPIGGAIQTVNGEWEQEVALTCGGDNRNATLLLPSRDQPEPLLHFFKVDTSAETAVSSLLNLKERISKPCECAIDTDCDDGNLCTTDSCKENLCDYVKEDPVCCNTDEECGEKVCVNHSCSEKQVPIGACQDDADCAKQEDGNLCNGKLYCDKSPSNPDEWNCKVNPGTVVIPCGTSSDTACLK
ncbi:MAG: hypothetical protein Q7T11_04900, partial [Deltaproteobacteria bacterium]|nr:hypothetical protein [Deltaproteobacteria bacterium]